MNLFERQAGRLQRALLHQGIVTASRVVRAVRPGLKHVECLRNVSYAPKLGNRAHRLDIYRPRKRQGLLPLLVYIHGGGFGICSKESHWMMGEMFAAAGFCVANVEYRRAPKAPYPAAVHDVRDALKFLLAHAYKFDADPSRLVLAGESAGANLALGLALSFSDGAFAQSGVRPSAVLAACGLLQVSDPERFDASPLVRARIATICRDYASGREAHEPMASPLLAIEDMARPVQLPPVLVQVGTQDPVQSDSVRLYAALLRRNVECTLHTYDGQWHAFQAAYWTSAAQRFWRDARAFLDAHGIFSQALGTRTPSS